MDIKFKAKVVMWEKVEFPKRDFNEQTKEWKVREDGSKEERTEYTLKSEFGDVLKLYGDNQYRDTEGKEAEIHAKIFQRSFQGKQTTRVRIEAITPLQDTKGAK